MAEYNNINEIDVKKLNVDDAADAFLDVIERKIIADLGMADPEPHTKAIINALINKLNDWTFNR